MVQLVVEGYFIDLYEDDPIKLNIIFDDLQFGQIADYTKSFRVPSTKHNNTFFKQAFEINDIDFDITIKRSAQILVDGTEYKRGEIRLLKIYLSEDGKYADYEIFFIGEKKEFQSSLQDKVLCQLDLSGYSHALSYTAITKSWEAYPSGTTTSGLFNGDILYPLVNFGNTWTGTTNEQPIIGRYNSLSNVEDQIFFTAATAALEQTRLRPMIRAKALIDQIFEEAGFTYESNFFNSNDFRNLYVSAWGNDAQVDIPNTSNLACAASYQYEGYGQENVEKLRLYKGWNPASYPNNEPLPNDPNNNWSNTNYEYTAPQNGTYATTFKFFANDVALPGETTYFKLRLHKLVGATETTLWTSPDLNTSFLFFTTGWTGTLNSGDKIYVKIYQSGTSDCYIYQPTYLNVYEAPGTINPSGLMDCQYKQIDFIKDILTKYRMIMIPQSEGANFLIEPWQDLIGSGNIYDWTDKIDNSKDITIEPTFYSQKKKLIFKDKSDGDAYNKYIETGRDGKIWGQLEVESGNDLLTDEQTITTNISTTPLTYTYSSVPIAGISGSFTYFRDLYNPQVYQADLNVEANSFTMKPIVPKTRLLFYNGHRSISDTWYLKNNVGTGIAQTKAPIVTSVSSLFGGYDFNWYNEKVLADFPDEQYQASQSIYDKYWSYYISTLYDKYARKLTAYFVLNFEDVRNLTPKDVIFIKNAYWYIKSISELEVGKDNISRVELIKLLQFNVPGDNYIPPESNLWNLDGDIWNTATQLWND